jgi:hypothetical protein
MNGLENILAFPNILNEQKSRKLVNLFNFKSINHLGFGHLGNVGLKRKKSYYNKKSKSI